MLFSFENASFRDQDSGVYNLAYFMEILFREWHRMIREDDNLSLIMVHPFYKSPAIENATCRSVASYLDSKVYRSTDIVSRVNNGDFLIGLFNLSMEGTDTIIKRIVEMEGIKDARNEYELVASAINLHPNQDLRVESIFDQLQQMLSQVESNKVEDRYQITELH